MTRMLVAGALIAAVGATFFAASLQAAGDVSVKALPPVVVQTTPRAGDVAVDATTTREIRVVFSKDMLDKSWSPVQINAENMPKIAGDPRYESDKRTWVLPVRLEPGHAYALWLNNSDKYQNFKDTGSQSAVPYLLVFETKK